MAGFVIIINGWKPLTIITKRSILGVVAALDPPLRHLNENIKFELQIVDKLCTFVAPYRSPIGQF